jgi:hypothetical protein
MYAGQVRSPQTRDASESWPLARTTIVHATVPGTIRLRLLRDWAADLGRQETCDLLMLLEV